MSWGTCYSSSNNIHFDFPPLMSDGRNYTNWEQPARVNEAIIKSNNIVSNQDYRSYLTQNASQLMATNAVNACDQCGSYKFKYQSEDSNGKYLYKSCVDSTQPYGYETSDLKNSYLSRQALQSRMVAPIMSQQEYLFKRALGQM